jgi:AraC-like DNA-binding protein
MLLVQRGSQRCAMASSTLPDKRYALRSPHTRPPDCLRRPLPSTPCVIGLVWRLLQGRRGSDARPHVADIARVLGRSERQLRRDWKQSRQEPLRNVLTYACLSFAWAQIAHGEKARAVALSAGFRSYWNFNRQSKAYGLCTARDVRKGAPVHISLDLIEDEIRKWDATQSFTRPD